MARSGLVPVASLLILAPTLALAAAPDPRTALSYDENVTINIACAGTLKRGDSAFTDCVNQQLAQLKQHPSPDRSGLSDERNQTIERKCNYLRRSSIGDYNDCLSKAMAAPAEPQTADNTDESLEKNLQTNYAKVFTEGDGTQDKPEQSKAEPEKPTPTLVADTTLPPPASVLPKRPDHMGKEVLEARELFKRVKQSIFVVVATRSLADARSRDVAQGSAVAISDHILLTNCHVVKDRPVIKIIQDGQATDAKLVAGKMALDRCVLEAKDITLHPVTGIRPFSDLEEGERVFAIGTPIGRERTLSEGLVSQLQHTAMANFVQTSAPVSPGSSGGGLFDEHGNLIGITTLGSFGRAQNINFAIAASDYWN
ncbi:MAG TPA: serine protease [Stellaceae bacterium]|nr:serine protease [Stellaceae bacterium]